MAITETVKDIDIADRHNPQCVVEYMEDIMGNLRATEVSDTHTVIMPLHTLMPGVYCVLSR